MTGKKYHKGNFRAISSWRVTLILWFFSLILPRPTAPNVQAAEFLASGPWVTLSKKEVRSSRQPSYKGIAEKIASLREEMMAVRIAGGEEHAFSTLAQIEIGLNQLSFRDRLTKWIGNVQDIVDYQIWVIDNRPVTVRKLIVAFMILLIGVFFAKYVLRAAGKRLITHAHLKESTALGIQKVLRYLAYLFILIFALRIVNIPLETFTFLGGAIAIGIGFGAQNLVNNFISGFLIMGERPINIGNIVEVDGVLGQVEEIGARSTRIRTGENIHILVPNSSFLEKSITNWTLSDRKIRACVTVGVRYGSPVREVERLLLKAAKEEKSVLEYPDPFILFNDFGDNALIFQLHFWISITRIIERLLIESSVRFRIGDLFREAGIVIAFPQRDVHLDTERPIEFRMIRDKTPPA